MTNYPPTPPPGFGELYVYADMVRVHVPGGDVPDWWGRGVATRGQVTEFSDKSRHRMQKKLAKARGLEWGVFATLTYPDNFPKEPDRWHRDIKVLIQRLRRLTWQTYGMWRLELKPRLSGEYEGWLAPHFHLLIFPKNTLNKPKLAVLRRWLRMAWYDVAHDGDKHQGSAGTQFDNINSRKHAVYYCSKYIGKVEGSYSIIANVGRHWGTFGEWDLSEFIRVWLSPSQLVNFKRMVRKWLCAKGTNASRSYSKKLSRAPPSIGLSIFGLGDCSHSAFQSGFTATIIQMIEICYQTPNWYRMVLSTG